MKAFLLVFSFVSLVSAQPPQPPAQPVFRSGASVYEPLPLPQIREHTQAQQRQLHPAIKRFVNPHEYPVGLEEQLHDLKTALILAARGFKP